MVSWQVHIIFNDMELHILYHLALRLSALKNLIVTELQEPENAFPFPQLTLSSLIFGKCQVWGLILSFLALMYLLF